MWWEWEEDGEEAARRRDEVPVDFDFISLLCKPKDYYKMLEVEYDALEEAIRSSYIRLALKWHPDKKQGEENATSRFQEINEAYQVLSNPAKRQEYGQERHSLRSRSECSGLSEPAQRFNPHMQWPWHKAFSMVSLLRGTTVCIHLLSWMMCVIVKSHVICKM